VSENTLSIALLVDDDSITEWQFRALLTLLQSDRVDVSITHVVCNTEETVASFQERVTTFIREFSLWNVYTGYRLLVRSDAWYDERRRLSALEDLGKPEILRVNPEPVDPFGNELPEEAINVLSSVDVAVRFGFGVLRGEALDAPECGVLSYHHGDLRKYRGRPAGFYEFLDGKSTAGVTIQRLSESLDGGEIAAFETVDIEDASSWLAVKSELFKASPELLPRAVENASGGSLQTPSSLGTLYTTPSNYQMLRYAYARLRHFVST
jgi:folate-dependent phosphoribosylglycinamide formyltransferase PurN